MRINQGLRAAAAGGIATDPSFRSNVLLLNGDGTNGAQNNTFIDGSTNNFAITRNGNTTQGSFSPYGDRWSAYFDGTGDWLTVPDNNTWAFSGNFTIEAWAYPTLLGAERIIVSQWFGGTVANTAFTIDFQATNKVRASFSSGGTMSTINSASTFTANNWYHIAAVRLGSTITLYVNGINEGTATLAGAINNIAQFLYIGALNNGGTIVSPFLGYISNVRVLNGTALYTSSFTPPTGPLTAITNTSLLACHANRFRDGSSNNFTITRNGDTRIERFSPFAPTAEYSTSVIGGSAYFDGTGGFLSLANTTALDFGTGDFTVEFWINASSVPSQFNVIGTAGSFQTGSTRIGKDNAAGMSLYANNGANIIVQESSFSTADINVWIHYAVVRSGNNFTLYRNGSSVGTGTKTQAVSLTLSGGVVIGTSWDTTGQNLHGYLSNLRALKGTALYTSSFTPPPAPLTAVTNTSLLLNAVNAGILDATASNVLETAGNVQISTVQKKYGTGSMLFDGNGDYLVSPSCTAYHLPGDFTIECWVYQNSTAGTQGIIVKRKLDTTETGTWGILASAGTFSFQKLQVTVVNTNFGTSVANTWQHIAVCRQGSTIQMFLNGTQGASVTDSTDYTNTRNLIIGAWDRSGAGDVPTQGWFNGYIDDLRITKGVARYTANFTPPPAALPLL